MKRRTLIIQSPHVYTRFTHNRVSTGRSLSPSVTLIIQSLALLSLFTPRC